MRFPSGEMVPLMRVSTPSGLIALVALIDVLDPEAKTVASRRAAEFENPSTIREKRRPVNLHISRRNTAGLSSPVGISTRLRRPFRPGTMAKTRLPSRDKLGLSPSPSRTAGEPPDAWTNPHAQPQARQEKQERQADRPDPSRAGFGGGGHRTRSGTCRDRFQIEGNIARGLEALPGLLFHAVPHGFRMEG